MTGQARNTVSCASTWSCIANNDLVASTILRTTFDMFDSTVETTQASTDNEDLSQLYTIQGEKSGSRKFGLREKNTLDHQDSPQRCSSGLSQDRLGMHMQSIVPHLDQEFTGIEETSPDQDWTDFVRVDEDQVVPKEFDTSEEGQADTLWITFPWLTQQTDSTSN